MLGQLLQIGQLLDGRYRIVKILPGGGFGQTYIAEDIKRPGNPECVVKQLRVVSHSPTTLRIARRLFETEAETLERLGDHDKIPRLFAYFEDNQNFYLVQEFISGQTLDNILQGQPLPVDQVRSLLTEILEILVFVHGQKVIHRDIKPSNLILRKIDDKIVLIDFGAVKEVITQTVNSHGQVTPTVAIGTPGYMPLEQLQGNPQFNSDIYALGVVCIQALTGLLAQDISKLRDPLNPNTGEIIWNQRSQHVSPQLVNVINKMVRFDCRQRYQSAGEVLNDLTASIPNSKPPQQTSPKTLWLFLTGVAAVIVVGVSFAIYTFSQQKYTKITYQQAVETVAEKAKEGGYQKNAPNILLQQQSLGTGNQQSQNLPLNGQAIDDKLGKGDAVLPNKSYYKLYVFEGQANQQVNVEMTSKEIDPALILLNADGRELTRNDDISPDNFNSRIVATLPQDGIYIVLARSSEAQQSQNLSLTSKSVGF